MNRRTRADNDGPVTQGENASEEFVCVISNSKDMKYPNKYTLDKRFVIAEVIYCFDGALENSQV